MKANERNKKKKIKAKQHRLGQCRESWKLNLQAKWTAFCTHSNWNEKKCRVCILYAMLYVCVCVWRKGTTRKKLINRQKNKIKLLSWGTRSVHFIYCIFSTLLFFLASCSSSCCSQSKFPSNRGLDTHIACKLTLSFVRQPLCIRFLCWPSLARSNVKIKKHNSAIRNKCFSAQQKPIKWKKEFEN